MHDRSLRPICKSARFDNPGQSAICSKSCGKCFRTRCAMHPASARLCAKQISLVKPIRWACLSANPQMTRAQKVQKKHNRYSYSQHSKAPALASHSTYVWHIALWAAGWEQKGSSAGVCVGAQYQVCLRQHAFIFVWLGIRFCDRGPAGP